jgi:hypothetical protein
MAPLPGEIPTDQPAVKQRLSDVNIYTYDSMRSRSTSFVNQHRLHDAGEPSMLAVSINIILDLHRHLIVSFSNGEEC